MPPDEILTEYVVDNQELRQIAETLLREFRLNLLKHFASTNSSVLNHLCRGASASATGTRSRGEDAFEKTGRKWNMTTLQEASDSVELDILQEQFP